MSGLDRLDVPAKRAGEECVVDPECDSGFCADNVCCDQACDGPCVTCRGAATRGRCLPHDARIDPDGDCGQFGRCDGNGNCYFEGVHQWSEGFGDDQDQLATGLTHRDAEELVMVGGFNGSIAFEQTLTAAGATPVTPNDLFVATFDASGEPRSSRRMGDEKVDRATSVATDSAGNVVVAGTFVGTLDVGGVLLQAPHLKEVAFLATLLQDLTTVRARAFIPQHPGFDQTTRIGAPAVAVANDDGVLVAGHFRGAIDFGLGPLSSIGDQDYYVAKFDAGGAPQWNNGWGSGQTTGDERPYTPKLAVDSEGNAYLAGTFRYGLTIGADRLPADAANAEQAFVAKVAPDGRPRWAVPIGGEGRQVVTAITFSEAEPRAVVAAGIYDGELAIAGQVWPASTADHVDLFVTKLSPEGTALLTRTFPGSRPAGARDDVVSAARDVAVDGTGNVVLFGQVHGSVSFGPSPLVALGLVDVFVAKLTTDLEHLWSKRYGDDGDQSAYAGSLDAAGNIVATGLFSGAIDFGGASPLVSAGGTDAFLVQFSP